MGKALSVRRIAFGSLGALVLVYATLVGFRAVYPMHFNDRILSVSGDYALDPAMVAAVVRWESGFRSDAVSPRGAIGLMQILPETGRWIAEQLGMLPFAVEQLYDPRINLQFGAWYLRTLLDRFGHLEDALAAYNAGPSRLERWRKTGEAPFPETAEYIDRVRRAIPIYRIVLRLSWLYAIVPPLSIEPNRGR